MFSYLPRTSAARVKFLGFLSLAFASLSIFFLYGQSYVGNIVYQTTPEPEHESKIGFNDAQFDFQADLTLLRQPKLDLKTFKDYKPHNHDPSRIQETFATFLCTRNASIHDPYFAATLNLVYRNLWAPGIASTTRPFTVFVAPFVSQEKRDILAGAGAVIKELDLLPWEPSIPGVYIRWRDQFTKLHFWNQTQYSTIVFMDSDTFLLKNIESVFDDVLTQKCDVSKLKEEDKADAQAMCDYAFAGVKDIGGAGVNGAFLVMKPNQAMHARLLRNYVRTDEYDNRVAEQSFLGVMFDEAGAFPLQGLPRKYNAYFPNAEDEGKVSLLHEKLWAFGDRLDEWLKGIWDAGWVELLEYFDSPAFVKAREADGKITG